MHVKQTNYHHIIIFSIYVIKQLIAVLRMQLLLFVKTKKFT